MPPQQPETRTRRRADAERSRTAILAAATRVLGTHPEAGLDEVAKAAGVSRQTVYAHFSSREALIHAVLDDVAAAVVAAVDAAMADAAGDEPAETSLLRLLSASAQVADRLPMAARGQPLTRERSDELHRPIVERLAAVIDRGRGRGEFTDALSRDWLVAAVIALAHTTADEVATGRMTAAEADAALQAGLRKLLSPG